MKIILNGQTKEFRNILDLHSLIGQFCNDQTPVIAELNGKIIRHAQWKETVLKEDDRLELISFVGGG